MLGVGWHGHFSAKRLRRQCKSQPESVRVAQQQEGLRALFLLQGGTDMFTPNGFVGGQVPCDRPHASARFYQRNESAGRVEAAT